MWFSAPHRVGRLLYNRLRMEPRVEARHLADREWKAVPVARQAGPALQVIDAVTFNSRVQSGSVLMNRLMGKDNPLRW